MTLTLPGSAKPTESPLISMVMPVHDAQHIDAALESLLAQQDGSELAGKLELIVVDDGSSAPLALRVTARFAQARVVRQPRRGPAAARNRGLQLARAPLVGFLDADDILLPGALARLLHILAHNPNLAAVHGTVRSFQTGGHPGASYPGYNLGALLARREALEAAGGFDEQLQRGEDADLFKRFRLQGLPVVAIAEPVLLYRERRASADQAMWRRRIELIRELRQRGEGVRAADELPDQHVTALLVVKDGMPYLPEAVASMRAQSCPPDRMLAVVAGADEDARAWLDSQPDIEVHMQTGSGLAQARNQALGLVDRGWLAFLDHDDLWEADKLARQRRLAARLTGPCAVTGRMVNRGKQGGRETADETSSEASTGWTPSALLIHREVFTHIGPFDERLDLACDSDWVRRLRASHLPFLLTPAVVMTKRRHSDNLSQSPQRNRAAAFSMIAKHRSQRRGRDA
ncbi:MAG: glycosyltransferase family A protein [Pseudomonadota bacterium]